MSSFSHWLGRMLRKVVRFLGARLDAWAVGLHRRFTAWLTVIRLRFAAWASWRHPVWLVALALLVAVLILVRGPSHPVAPVHRPVPSVVPVSPPKLGTGMDAAIVAALAGARQEAVGLGQRRVAALVGTLAQRVQTVFVPWYLSFGRRKLEEIRAYNTFAMSWIGGLASGNFQDESRRILVKTFEDEFSARVLTPMETRQALQAIGREVAQDYGSRVTLALQNIQERRAISFPKWQKYLEKLPPGQLSLAAKPMVVPLPALAAPDPIREVLGEDIGKTLVDRFTQFPSVASDHSDLQVRDGRSIFEVGRNAWAYYGSYVIYWIVLISLIRSGFIPINLSGALVGWLIWETFAWGSWITWESLDFEQTRLQMEPLIVHHSDNYFVGMRATLTDPGPEGPFQVLHVLERSWEGG
ncbi:conserved hypothetical protein [Gammaproteobacteria bacterium]